MLILFNNDVACTCTWQQHLIVWRKFMQKFIMHYMDIVPINIFLFKFINRNTSKWCELCSELTLKTLERAFLLSCKIPKTSPRTYIFQRGFLVGLYSVPFMFERSNFRMWRLRKELIDELWVTILTSCVYSTS